MRVPVRWLQELTGIELPAEETAKLLSAKGISVEGTTRIADGFEGVRVGEVVEIQSHRLTLFDGRDVIELEAETASAKPDMKVAFRPESRSLVRQADVGLADSTEFVCLPAEVEAGTAVRSWIDDDILIVELPPSRGDLTGIIGIAREFACFAGREFTLPAVDIIEDGERISDCLRVVVDDAADTPDYIARLVRGVRVAPSPFWLKWRLQACGIRPISNAVDVTNYVMFKYGQPLHGFDLARLGGGRLVTRRARKGERLSTIDGVERPLDERILVIADETGPVAIAGIMGGRASEITGATQDVVIECARFAPAVIRHGSRAIGLATEASLRFELGIDPGLMEAASREAAGMMKDICAGRIAAGKAEVRTAVAGRVIPLSWDRTRRLLGMPLAVEQMAGVLRRLGFGLKATPEGADVTIPSHRSDVEGAADLAEEIGRVTGYDGIPSLAGYSTAQPGNTQFRTQRIARVRELMVAAGFNEIQTISFLPEAAGRVFDHSGLVVLQKPLNERFAALRPSLLPNLLEVASLNLRRGFGDLRLLEVGTVFSRAGMATEAGRAPKEQVRLAGVVCGSREPVFWGARSSPCDVYDVKGALESLFSELQFGIPEFAGPAGTGFDARFSSEVRTGDAVLGNLGRLTQELTSRYDIDVPVYAFDLNLEMVLGLMVQERALAPLSRFPSVVRDYAFITRDSVTTDHMLAVARSAGGTLVEGVEVFDRFQGKPLPEDRQSIGIRLTLRAAGRTLTAADVDSVTERLVAAMKRELDAGLRA